MIERDLRVPFSWEERRPFLGEGFFYVPDYFFSHEEWPIDPFCSVAPSVPITVEYCSGNGQWIVEKALRYPEIYWVAVEKRWDRARKIWRKGQNRQLTNLFVVWGEAWTFTRFYVRPDRFSSAFINFPDPWPKKRHEKHRLLTPEFLEELSRVLHREGKIVFVTDDGDLSDRSIALFFSDKRWGALYEEPYYITEWLDFGASYFEGLWRSKGREIRYHQFLNGKACTVEA